VDTLLRFNSRLIFDGDRCISNAILRIESPAECRSLRCSRFEQTQVPRMDDLLNPVQVDGTAYVAFGTCRIHGCNFRVRITHNATIWVDPTSMDDPDALVAVGRRAVVGANPAGRFASRESLCAKT
jgi:hypothetical protein